MENLIEWDDEKDRRGFLNGRAACGIRCQVFENIETKLCAVFVNGCPEKYDVESLEKAKDFAQAVVI